ncbi:MAG: hypothetical protein WC405_10065 [Syntrophales bacterium]
MTKRGMLGLIVGAACAWIIIDWLVGPSPQQKHNPPQTVISQSEKAHQQNRDQIADVQWRQLAVTEGGVGYLTLNNLSGMDVLVKVVSVETPSLYRTVTVRDNSTVEVECPAKSLFLKMRYRTPEGYRYQKGDNFPLTAGSRVKITLHKVVGGNYGSSAISQDQF